MLSAIDHFFPYLFNESIVEENNCLHTFPTKYVWIIDQARGQDGWILAAKYINTQKYAKKKKKNGANIQPS